MHIPVVTLLWMKLKPSHIHASQFKINSSRLWSNSSIGCPLRHSSVHSSLLRSNSFIRAAESHPAPPTLGTFNLTSNVLTLKNKGNVDLQADAASMLIRL